MPDLLMKNLRNFSKLKKATSIFSKQRNIPKLKKNLKKQNTPNEIFGELKGQTIQKFSVRGNADQHFHLVTDKIDLRFGANDLGVWIEKYKVKNQN